MHSRKNRYAPYFGASNEWFRTQIIFLGLLKSTPMRYHLSQENILFCSVLSGLSIVEQQQQQPQQRRKKSATSKFYKEKSFFNKINEIILILTISLKKKTILTLQKEQSL